MTLELLVRDTNLRLVSRHTVGDSPITVGRAPDCSLRLDDSGVSRYHLTLRVEAGQLDLIDSSSNGTMVGERLLIGGRLRVPLETPLLVGRSLLRVELSPAAPAAPPVPGVPE